MKKVKYKKTLNYLILSLSSALALSAASFAADNTRVAPSDSNAESQVAEQGTNFTDAELAQMLAPIALYPDTLLTHILIATTYPIEVVDAERWASKNSQLSAQALADAAEDKDWDPSVKALLPFPNILKKLSEDLRWMRNLGDAFLQNEAQVLSSVQTLRSQADKAGNLDNMGNVKVVRSTKTIVIEPTQTDVIYVPYYDTRVVYGNWRWSHYPPVYWHQPLRYTSHHGPFYWDNPVHLSVGLFFGAVMWNNHHVVVHRHKSRYYKHHSKKKRSTSYLTQRWVHNPQHRKGVAYRSSRIQKKYRSHTPSVQQHKIVRAKQKHSINENRSVIKNNSRKHQSLKHKLQVNRAVKIDKHDVRKNSLNKSKSHTSDQWRNKKDKNKYRADKPDLKNHRAQKNNQVFAQKKRQEKSYRKQVKASKNANSKNHSTKSTTRTNSHSTTKTVSHRKIHSNRSQQSRSKRQN